ncbi:MAG: AAA family ATPase [Thermoleophilaceae bacterium]|nr:AAA family ATPase [Thermoleophilaceae bacterium]
MTAVNSFAPRHFNGLEDARTITTHQFLVTEMAVEDCIHRQAIGLFTGGAGTGKTFAVESATAELDLPVVRTLFGSKATPREVARQILCELGEPPARGSYYDLADEVVRCLVDPHVVVIDEAQHLNQDCTFFIRHLIDREDTQVTILLVGAEGLITKVRKDPTLDSRIYRRVGFAEMSEEELLGVLPNYHPIYRGVSRALLEDLIDRCEVVKHRVLAVFTLTAADLLAREERESIDKNTLDKSLALISGGLT